MGRKFNRGLSPIFRYLPIGGASSRFERENKKGKVMKKVIILILVLILSFVGFQYWEKLLNKESLPQSETSIDESSILHNQNDLRNYDSRNTKELLCSESANKALFLFEVLKQQSEMCGLENRATQFFDSPKMVAVNKSARECIYRDGLKKGRTSPEARKYADDDTVLKEVITSLFAKQWAVDKNVICKALDAKFTKLGF